MASGRKSIGGKDMSKLHALSFVYRHSRSRSVPPSVTALGLSIKIVPEWILDISAGVGFTSCHRAILKPAVRAV